MKRKLSAFAEVIPPYSGPKAARESHVDLQHLSDIPKHIYSCPDLQILHGHRRFSRLPWLLPMIDMLPPASISLLKEWGLSTVLVLAKKYDKIIHVWDSITALTELWHTQTHSFNFPGFEATILLEELEIMLGLPRYYRGEEIAISYTWRELESVRRGAGGASTLRGGENDRALLQVQLTVAISRAEVAERHLEDRERDLRLTTEHAMDLQAQRVQRQGELQTTRGDRDQLRIPAEAAEARVAAMTTELAALRVQRSPVDREELERLRAELRLQESLAQRVQQIVTDIGRSRSRSRSAASANRATGGTVGQYIASSSSRRRNEAEERCCQDEGGAQGEGGGGAMLPPPERQEGSGECGGGE
ncbi:hypothetical protein Taro_041483 [Colocasia esculenta]|uniref:Aminotransferase-like plant mobile domain-containing protein n=1 Tax=Colocasia esculenta TaxID=4460 RepID=A0A843WXE5_COLES|nr:hypothetical protein [Colocasia esculenta]